MELVSSDDSIPSRSSAALVCQNVSQNHWLTAAGHDHPLQIQIQSGLRPSESRLSELLRPPESQSFQPYVRWIPHLPERE